MECGSRCRLVEKERSDLADRLNCGQFKFRKLGQFFGLFLLLLLVTPSLDYVQAFIGILSTLKGGGDAQQAQAAEQTRRRGKRRKEGLE